jgi:hypothetical protein
VTKSRIIGLGLLLFLLCLAPDSMAAAEVKGTVYDMQTGEALPYVTVQIVNTGRSTLANQDGHFRILVDNPSGELKFSHIGYYSKWLGFSDSTSGTDLQVYLPPAVVELKDVVVSSWAYDAGQRIILEAIKRKQEILEKLSDYSYDAYTKVAVWDQSKGKDSAKIMVITESQSTSYWEYPDKYKEVITARRQSANMAAEGNLVAVGEVLNFNKNRIDLNDWSVITPVAEDALDYYDYRLVDSTSIDGQKVYDLDITPKNQIDPLFTGRIQIVDSTFDVVGVDVGFNDAIDVPILEDLRYRQRYALFSKQFWMPVEIGLNAILKINFPGIPSPLEIDYTASLHSYSFEQGIPKGTFGEYLLEVSPLADHVDSSAWRQHQAIPLTVAEERGYQRLDSLEKAPKPLRKRLVQGLMAATALITVGDYDFLHIQRVDGAYLGLRLGSSKLIPRTSLWAKGGYGFDSRLWQYQLGFTTRVREAQRMSLGAVYRRQIVSRPLIGKNWYNPTFQTLFFKQDPFDYFRDEGVTLFGSTKLINYTTLNIYLTDQKQSSVHVNTDFSLFGGDNRYRPNPEIADGYLRSVGGSVVYDSRKMWNDRGHDVKIDSPEYTILKLGAELSSPDFLNSDFDYRKYYISAFRRQRVFDLGISTIDLYAGASTRSLPPQEYYGIGFDDPFVVDQRGFLTTGDHMFFGNRILMLHLTHDFGKLLFQRSGMPLIRDIPFTLAVHGGAFWSEFRDHAAQPGDHLLDSSPKPYTELGLTVGNLSPFIWPFNLSLTFSWQLSDYDTNRFMWLIGVDL